MMCSNPREQHEILAFPRRHCRHVQAAGNRNPDVADDWPGAQLVLMVTLHGFRIQGFRFFRGFMIRAREFAILSRLT